MDEQEALIAAKILHKHLRRGAWQHVHTNIENLQSGFRGHEKGRVKEVVNELVKMQFLIAKPTHYGTEVSLNARMQKEILAFKDEYFK